mmetsp:Transcript_78839/g.231372  ORF Transcript_78839/g.231372 Transcript_78839/m.231372 type:complete len:200 (+) Transcript_78839:273-872(+)
MHVLQRVVVQRSGFVDIEGKNRPTARLPLEPLPMLPWYFTKSRHDQGHGSRSVAQRPQGVQAAQLRLQAGHVVVLGVLVAPVGHVVGHAQARAGELQRHGCQVPVANVPVVGAAPAVPQQRARQGVEAGALSPAASGKACTVHRADKGQEGPVEGAARPAQAAVGPAEEQLDAPADVREVLPPQRQGEGVHEVHQVGQL